MYRLSAFYFARTASDLPMDLTIPSVFIFLIYFMSGLRLTAGAFFSNWTAVMLTTLVAQSLGLLIGATVMVPKTAQTITAVLMLGMMLVRAEGAAGDQRDTPVSGGAQGSRGRRRRVSRVLAGQLVGGSMGMRSGAGRWARDAWITPG
jgi:ABC-2 type transporter